MYLDGDLLIDHWGLHGATPKSSSPASLSARMYPIVVEYFEGPVTAEIRLKWRGPGISTDTLIPAANFVAGFNLETSKVDEASNTTTYVYEDESTPDYYNDEDAFYGNLVEERRTNTPVAGAAQTLKWRNAYNAFGQQTQKTLPKGMTSGSPDAAYTTTYAYYGNENATDSCTGTLYPQEGLLKSVSQPGLATVGYTHDGQGAVVAQSDEMGTTCGAYDALGRMTSMKAPDRATATTYAYDPDGRLKTVSDPTMPAPTNYTFDDLGRLATSKDSMAPGPEAAGTFSYDEHSNLVSRTDKTGTTGYLYDQLDRMTRVTDHAGRFYDSEWDDRSRLTKQKYPNGTETRLDYDALNRVSVQETLQSPAGATLAKNAYERDIRGLVKKDDGPDGMWVYTYDALRRLEQSHYPNTGRTHRFLFDENSNRSSSKLTRGWNTLKTVSSYASALTDGVPLAGLSGDDACAEQLLGFNFPFAGTTYDRVHVSTNGYVQLGSNSGCAGKTANLDSDTRRLIAPYNRDLKIDPTSTANPGRGVYVELLATPAASLRIRWKAELAGTSVQANFEVMLHDNGQIRFRYGVLPSVTARVGATPGNQVDFVAVSGFDRKTVPSGASDVVLTPASETTDATYTHNALDQFTASGAVGAVAYNSDGDQTSITGPAPRGTVALGFDGRHLVTSQLAAGNATTWSIDGEARVTKQIKAGAETRYRYAGPGDTPAWEEDAAGTITTSFVAGPLGLLATYVWGNPSFHVLDAHGNAIQMRNLAGTLTDAYLYGEAGGASSTSGGQPPHRHGYLARYQKDHEEDSGFMRMGVRMYDTASMRFASWDPVDGGDWNAYSYAGQDAINGLDLTGEMHIDGGGGCGSKCTKPSGRGSRGNGRGGAKPSPTPSPQSGIRPVAAPRGIDDWPNGTTNWFIVGGAAYGAIVCWEAGGPGGSIVCGLIGAGAGAVIHWGLQQGRKFWDWLSR